ncbi:syntaxin-4 isoform X2 [Mustela putorius furo]|uniref:Syntaxin-4 isoform X2 n=1 Tax=Mustela putorius furo TaxID=9669 RepID=A0A8U0UVI6_MUSPF|nr:syntaxin-4 isoform X2 [Mustela putorius furo]
MTVRTRRTRSGSRWWCTRALRGWGARTTSSSTSPLGHLPQVRTIRQTIVKLENKVRELEKQQVTILATPLPEESMKQDLQNLREEIKQLGREIRSQLKAIEPQNEEADENYNSVNTRMRKTQGQPLPHGQNSRSQQEELPGGGRSRTQILARRFEAIQLPRSGFTVRSYSDFLEHGVLSQQFVELINKCNLTQSEYREKNVERIRRQLKITNAGMVSDEELEQMLDSGQSEVFVSNILKDTQVTRQALNEISARHSEIQQLERSIRELHEIFTFLATEVEMQCCLLPENGLQAAGAHKQRRCRPSAPSHAFLPEARAPLSRGR